MNKKPDFYMISSEWRVLKEPRACWILRKLEYQKRKDLFLIKVNPPIVYEDKEAGTVELGEVIIVSRHKGVSIVNAREWPVYVHMAKLVNTASLNKDKLENGDLENIAWAELYHALGDAEQSIL